MDVMEGPLIGCLYPFELYQRTANLQWLWQTPIINPVEAIVGGAADFQLQFPPTKSDVYLGALGAEPAAIRQ